MGAVKSLTDHELCGVVGGSHALPPPGRGPMLMMAGLLATGAVLAAKSARDTLDYFKEQRSKK